MLSASPESRGRRAAASRALLALALLSAGCGRRDAEPGAAVTVSRPFFVDVTTEAGLRHEHVNGRTGVWYYPEIVGPGGALFDYDNDGDLDVYLVQGGVLDPETGHGAVDSPGDRLFGNQLDSALGPESLRFEEVTAASRIDARGYGMGVAVGDVDNDGWLDLYLTNFGPNELWRNRGDGTFEPAPAAAGAADDRWSTSAAFLDYDRDGWLDLYVVAYVDYRMSDRRECFSESGRREYCGPQNYSGETDRLFRNRGDGSFEDVSGAAGLFAEPGSGLGVVSADFDGDGWADLYVANDLMPNVLWRNRGDGTFENTALIAGAAVNMAGLSEASMGVDAGDVDNDGDVDIFLTHLRGETNTLYRNQGNGFFDDASQGSGLGAASLPATGFGTALLDYDNDGWLDIVAVNGAVHLDETLARSGDAYPFQQRNQLFRNRGHGRFEDVTDAGGAAFEAREISRGAAVGDVDNDGDSDLLVLNTAGPARLLRNEAGGGRSWLGVRLVGADGLRDQLGATATLRLRDGTTLLRRVRSAASYCSANDPRLLFGLGEARPVVESLQVAWPSGHREAFADLTPGRYAVLREGSGRSLQEEP